MLQWLESSYLARVVLESLWGFPIVLTSHAVGMAVLAGIVLIINFRILGLAPQMPLISLKPIFKVAMVGLVINVISGVLLFIPDASKFLESTPFIIKLILLVIGGALLIYMPRRIFNEAEGNTGAAVSSSTRLLAGLSALTWLGVIVSGRLIAYVDVGAF